MSIDNKAGKYFFDFINKISEPKSKFDINKEYWFNHPSTAHINWKNHTAIHSMQDNGKLNPVYWAPKPQNDVKDEEEDLSLNDDQEYEDSSDDSVNYVKKYLHEHEGEEETFTAYDYLDEEGK